MNLRIVRQHVQDKIDNQWRRMIEDKKKEATKTASDLAKSDVAAFKAAHKRFRAAHKEVKETISTLKASGICVNYGWENDETPELNLNGQAERYAREEADAWRRTKMEEFNELLLKLALSKDRMGVVEEFLKGLK